MTGHGGDISAYRREYGEEPLDFSANISPLGLPKKVRAACVKALCGAGSYPDAFCTELVGRISQAERLPGNWILCSNGAADLIYRLAISERPKRALITAPAFSEYEAALNVVGCEVVRHQLKKQNNYGLGRDFLDAVAPGVDMVFLCQPNNPTGQIIEPKLLFDILARCDEVGAVLAADECFIDFLDKGEAHSLKKHLGDYKCLVILKAFTKFYAMAGLRLGYALCSDENLLARLRRAGQPWAVSGVAQAAGEAALGDWHYAWRLKRLVARERRWLYKKLTKLGLDCTTPHANFIFFETPKTDLAEKLRGAGIMIRDCKNYHGLHPGCFRVAVFGRAQNKKLIAALAKELS